jgi:hypothetical protein
MTFPDLPTDWDATRSILHAHAASVGVVARAHAEAHPKWWHLGLTVTDGGLASTPIELPDGRSAVVVIDPGTGKLRVEIEGSVFAEYSLAEPPSTIAAALFELMSDLGLDGEYDHERLHEDPAGEYDESHAAAFWAALRAVATALERRKAARPDPTGPVQLWPHGFDISFEWFGTKKQMYGEGDAAEELPAQLNLGWDCTGDAYFYSNPWPFDQSLTEVELPGQARWHTDGWEGTILRYDEVSGDPDGERDFVTYADAVFAITRPTLEA